MKQKFTKLQIRKMKRIYTRTRSLEMTAKICDCSVSTIQRYRDREGWVALAVKPDPSPETTCSTDIAMRLAVGWRQDISDEALCNIVGVTIGQLKMWLMRNVQVSILHRVKAADPKSKKPAEFDEERIGLRDLRTRQLDTLEYDYLQRLEKLYQKAEDADDFATAIRGRQWRLEKRRPKKYGSQAVGVKVEVNNAMQTNVVSIDDLNLPLETRKAILAQLRAQQNGESQDQS